MQIKPSKPFCMPNLKVEGLQIITLTPAGNQFSPLFCCGAHLSVVFQSCGQLQQRRGGPSPPSTSPPVLLPSGRAGQPTDRPAPPRRARPPRRDATRRGVPRRGRGRWRRRRAAASDRTRAAGRARSVRGGGGRGKVGGRWRRGSSG
jgi:hypothetical protein